MRLHKAGALLQPPKDTWGQKRCRQRKGRFRALVCSLGTFFWPEAHGKLRAPRRGSLQCWGRGSVLGLASRWGGWCHPLGAELAKAETQRLAFDCARLEGSLCGGRCDGGTVTNVSWGNTYKAQMRPVLPAADTRGRSPQDHAPTPLPHPERGPPEPAPPSLVGGGEALELHAGAPAAGTTATAKPFWPARPIAGRGRGRGRTWAPGQLGSSRRCF